MTIRGSWQQPEDWSEIAGAIAIPAPDDGKVIEPDGQPVDDKTLPALSTPEERVRGRRQVTVKAQRWTYWVTFEWTHPDVVSKPESERRFGSTVTWTRTLLTKRGLNRWIARRNREYDQQLLEERSTFTVAV